MADEEENAGNPIGSPKALVQTDIATQVTAALTVATQRWQKDLEASRAKSAAKIREQLCDHQVWWTHTLKEQHAAQSLLWKQLAELVSEKQRALEEANANIRVVNEALDRAARNTLQSQLLVQSLSHYAIKLLCERAKCGPSKHIARGKTYAAAAEEAEAGCKGPSNRIGDVRTANNARHRTLRMKIQDTRVHVCILSSVQRSLLHGCKQTSP
jgi:hypothetical protein